MIKIALLALLTYGLTTIEAIKIHSYTQIWSQDESELPFDVLAELNTKG